MQTEAVFDNIAERIQFEISRAQKSIFIAVAWFTNKVLFNELVNKAKSGCRVYLLISNDEINNNSSLNYDELTEVDKTQVFRIGSKESELMHNKFCVIDYCIVITGSYNWSYKAENNFENIIITTNDITLVEQYISEFKNICNQFYPQASKEIEDFVEKTKINIESTLQDLIPYRKKDKWGFCRPDKKILIDCIYSNVEPLRNGLFRINLDNKCGLINKKGEIIIPILYTVLRDFREQVIAAKLNGKFGFIDINGKTILPFIYDAATDFYDGKAMVEIDGQMYNVDKTNSMERKIDDGYFYKIDDSGHCDLLSKSEPTKGWITQFQNFSYQPRLVDLSLGDFLNSDFGTINLPNEQILGNSNGMIAFRKDGKYGFMNSENLVVIPPIYDNARLFEDGITRVEINQKVGYINKEGIQYWED